MAKSPIEINLRQGQPITTIQEAAESIQSVTKELIEAYRLLRGDIKKIEERLDDGGL